MEFLRYPHLIPALFNVRGFGPPVRFTAPSTWTWVDHMVSGLRQHTHSPYSDSLSLRLRLFNLTSHAIVTRRFILQKARHHPLTGSDFFQAHGFRFSFTPLPRFFSPFPHGTRSLSLTLYILPWRMVPPASDKISRVPPYSGYRLMRHTLRLRGFHSLWLYFPVHSAVSFALF